MMEKTPRSKPTERHYFVDEAGDPVLFNRKKRIVVGTEGCSSFFILGLMDISEPEKLGNDLSELRSQVLADPYFAKVPSMRPERKKTALAFHAKDDVAEVRREVFKLLMRHQMRFFAVVRDKHQVVAYVRQRNERSARYRYNANELYDSLVSRLFKDRLHKDDGYHISFARRGASDRTAALKRALEKARRNFEKKWGIASDAPIRVTATTPKDCAGLQAVDYFLWALQRFFERGEDRYLEYVWPSVSLVHDVDDTRQAKYGIYYTQRNPLTKEARAKE
jgi:uncharacterized protein DUF3800